MTRTTRRNPCRRAPAQIYYGHIEGSGPNRMWVSNGYSSTCPMGSSRCGCGLAPASHRVRVDPPAGPPAFAPDTFHVRTVADDLEQIAFGPLVAAPCCLGASCRHHPPRGSRRFGSSTRRRGTTTSSRPSECRTCRPRHRVRPGTGTDLPAGKGRRQKCPPDPRGRHRTGGRGGPDRRAGHPAAAGKAGDLTNARRRKMPAMMRASDALHLADPPSGRYPPKVAGRTFPARRCHSEANMVKLIDTFFSRRNRHLGISVDDTHTLTILGQAGAAQLSPLRERQGRGSWRQRPASGQSGGAGPVRACPPDPDDEPPDTDRLAVSIHDDC